MTFGYSNSGEKFKGSPMYYSVNSDETKCLSVLARSNEHARISSRVTEKLLRKLHKFNRASSETFAASHQHLPRLSRGDTIIGPRHHVRETHSIILKSSDVYTE